MAARLWARGSVAGLAALLLTSLAAPALGQSQQPTCAVDSEILGQQATLDLPMKSASAQVAQGGGSGGGDLVFLGWEPMEDADCVWITARGGYDTFYPRVAVVSAPADAPGVGVTPEGQPGLFCYLFVPVRDGERGPHAEVCVEVANPVPAAEPESLGPESTGDNWDWGRTLLVAGLVAAAVFFPAVVLSRALLALGAQPDRYPNSTRAVQ